MIAARHPPPEPKYLDCVKFAPSQFKLKWGLPPSTTGEQKDIKVVLQFKDVETEDWQCVQGPVQGTSHRFTGGDISMFYCKGNKGQLFEVMKNDNIILH